MTRSPLEIRLVCWLAGLYGSSFVWYPAEGLPLVVSIVPAAVGDDVAAS